MAKKLSPGKFFLMMLALFAVLPFPVFGFPVSLESDGDILYMVHQEGTIEMWNKSSGSLVNKYSVDTSVWSSETGKNNLYAGCTDGRMLIIDQDGRILKEVNVTPETVVSAIAIDEGSQTLYTGSYDNIIRVWDMRDWSLDRVIEDHRLPVNDLALDDRYLYSASGDGSVKVWDKQTMVLVKNLTTHTDWQTARKEKYPIWKLVVEGDKVYTGHVNGNIRIWDLETDSLVREVEAHTGDVGALITDGRYIFSSRFKDKSVKIWTMEGEPAGSVDMEYSPRELAVDDDYLYVGVREGGILVYDKNDRNLVREMGNFTETAPQTSEKQARPPELNPLLPVVLLFALFLAGAVALETYTNVKKEYGKLTRVGVKKFLASFVMIEDVLKILAVSSVIIFVVGLLNIRAVFPSYVHGLQAIYYFDILVRNGAFLPVWFLSFPSLAYWAAKKHKKRNRYLITFIALLIAVAVYLAAPAVT